MPGQNAQPRHKNWLLAQPTISHDFGDVFVALRRGIGKMAVRLTRFEFLDQRLATAAITANGVDTDGRIAGNQACGC